MNKEEQLSLIEYLADFVQYRNIETRAEFVEELKLGMRAYFNEKIEKEAFKDFIMFDTTMFHMDKDEYLTNKLKIETGE